MPSSVELLFANDFKSLNTIRLLVTGPNKLSYVYFENRSIIIRSMWYGDLQTLMKTQQNKLGTAAYAENL